MKRFSALLLVAAMLVMLASCAPAAQPGTQDGEVTSSGIDTQAEISITVISHPSWPYNENWEAWQNIRECTGANLKITAIPGTDYQTKLQLMMADPNSLTDLISMQTKTSVDGYAASGALIAIDDYLDEMPNYTAFWNSIPEHERELRLMQRRSADGKTYYPQTYGTDNRQGVRMWIYRKDILEKNNLSAPESMEELYETSKKLKQIYPESYPLCLRDTLRNINVIGSQWRPYLHHGVFYDFDEEKWYFGGQTEELRAIVEYFRKMHAEGLVPPDYVTITAKSWEELMSTDRGFFAPEFAVRIDFFNNPNRETNPDYTFAFMKPPVGNTGRAQAKLNKFNVDPKGYMICNTRDEKRILNAIKYVDWFYSDEAADITGWGKENQTYTVNSSGEREFIFPEDASGLESKYGLHSHGTYLRIDPKAALAMASNEQAAAVIETLEYTEDGYNPLYWLAFDEDNAKRMDEISSAIATYSEEMLSKFLLNKIPMSEWDVYVKELESFNVEELLDLYESAYKKATNG